MAILETAGSIGSLAAPLQVNTSQLGILTSGSSFNVNSAQQLSRLYVQTAGTTATQAITDLGGNLNYDVYENSLTTFIGNAQGNTAYVPVAGGTGGFYVDSGSIDFTYINTSGGITVGTEGILSTPTGWSSGISFGIMATQDPNANGGQGAAATPGKVTLRANGALTVDDTVPVLQPGTIGSDLTGVPYPTGTPVPGIQATGGGIFTGVEI